MPVGEYKGSARGESMYDSDAKLQGYGQSMADLELVRVDCGPSYCPVEARLELAMEFTIDRPLRDASWEIKFLVDSVNERHVVWLGNTAPRDYARGPCSMHFEVPRVSVDGIKPCTLANTGLLIAALKCSGGGGGRFESTGQQEVAAVNLVVQVADEGHGRFTRCIYSPLE